MSAGEGEEGDREGGGGGRDGEGWMDDKLFGERQTCLGYMLTPYAKD